MRVILCARHLDALSCKVVDNGERRGEREREGVRERAREGRGDRRERRGERKRDGRGYRRLIY